MRKWRLFFITLISFIAILRENWLKKIIPISLCILLNSNSAACYINFNDGRVDAAISNINLTDNSSHKILKINQDLPTKQEDDFQHKLPSQLAIPPIIRPAETNLYLQNALPKDFRISSQIPYSSGKQEILLVSPSTGAEQLYTFNVPGSRSFQLFEVEYKKVSAIDFTSLINTDSLIVNPEQIKSVLNKFKITFANNSLSKITLSDGTTANFFAGQAIIKSPQGQTVETVQISQNEFIDKNIFISQERGKMNKNIEDIKTNKDANLLAKTSESACQAAVSSSLNFISDSLGLWGNKLTTSKSPITKSVGWAISFGSGAIKSNISTKNPMLQEVNCRPPVQCEEQRVSGGSEIRTDLFQVAKGANRKVNLKFEFYVIPDRIELYFDGKQIFGLGPKSGPGNETFDLPTNAEYVGVKLIGNDNVNTRWDYTISCSGGEPEIASLNKWWATIGEKYLPIKLTIKVPKKGKYSLSVNVESIRGWQLKSSSKVIIDGKTLESKKFLFPRSSPKAMPSFRQAIVELDELDAGEHKVEIDAFEVPPMPIVQEILFKLKGDNSQQDKLVALFVADWPETGNYQALVDKYAPILYFDNGQGTPGNKPEKYNIPYDVEKTTWLNKPKDYKLGDSTTVIDLSSYAIKPRNNTSGKVYAAVVKHPTKGEVAINYYFHYPRSNWEEHGGHNTHEGDWEGITVFLDKYFRPSQASFAQHIEVGKVLINTPINPFGEGDGGQTVLWQALELEKGRPKVYVGLGGHASYPYRGTTLWKLPSQKKIVEFHRGNLANPFDSQGRIQYLSRIGNPIAPDWLRYPGYWGRQNILNKNDGNDGDDGPRGPVFLDLSIINLMRSTGRGERWLDPWEWSKNFDVVEKK
ncbi:hypothetical protein H6F32_12305 [Anabaena sp. FACHB-1237]|uniref:hypothetical protein n=1 Tax=Anabaena sp. FACHB-1237 TaxID=2692769 RepID=UPI0016802978|nr:hypothetical protein [Anabaena sp. FACHB-1237]MBD2138357.1 hypothetical protein [Anabaena sp. FACHB-1237]